MFSNMLKELRRAEGCSQTVLGQKLGFSQQAIAQWENGTREPDNKTLRKIANYFNVTVDYLLGHSSADDNNLREVEIIDKATLLAFLDKTIADTLSNKVKWIRYSEHYETDDLNPRYAINYTLSFLSFVAGGEIDLFYYKREEVGLSIKYNKDDDGTSISVPYDPELQSRINELYNIVYSKLPSLEGFISKFLDPGSEKKDIQKKRDD